jgi:hypothetical protein
VIDVYHWEPNAHQGKPVIALYEKGVNFVSHHVELLDFEQASPAFLAVNPEGIVPVMDHDRQAHQRIDRDVRVRRRGIRGSAAAPRGPTTALAHALVV